MKKIVLSLAGVMAAAAFAPEASAIPAFARQTGLACSSCHFQHFPVLSTTGQEFKVGAYTQVSAKGKFKGDDLSIPDTLNAAILLKARYQKTNGSDVPGTYDGTTTNSGQWQIPDELSLFFGGRVADNGTIKIGFMNENNMVGGPAGGIIAGLKVPVAIALDPVTVQVVPYGTDALGMAYGYEQSSTGMTRGVRWAENRSDISAAQFTGMGSGTASGLAFVVNSDIGYINVSRWSPQFFYVGGVTGVKMSSTWVRVAATPTIGDWAMHIGAGMASGTSSCVDPLTAPGTVTAGVIDPAPTHSTATDCETKGTVVDFQAQGAIAEMETSVYAQYSSAPSATPTATSTGNLFNGSSINSKSAVSAGIDVSVIPHTLHVGASVLSGNDGKATAADTDKVTSVTLTAIYDLFQNVALHANYSMRSGSAYDTTTGTRSAATLPGGSGKTLLTLMLEAAW